MATGRKVSSIDAELAAFLRHNRRAMAELEREVRRVTKPRRAAALEAKPPRGKRKGRGVRRRGAGRPGKEADPPAHGGREGGDDMGKVLTPAEFAAVLDERVKPPADKPRPPAPAPKKRKLSPEAIERIRSGVKGRWAKARAAKAAAAAEAGHGGVMSCPGETREPLLIGDGEADGPAGGAAAPIRRRVAPPAPAPSLTDLDDASDAADAVFAPAPRVPKKVRAGAGPVLMSAEERRLLEAYRRREAELERERAAQAQAAPPAPAAHEARPRFSRGTAEDAAPINPMRQSASDGPPPAWFDPEKPQFEEAALKNDWRVTPRKRTKPALRDAAAKGAGQEVRVAG